MTQLDKDLQTFIEAFRNSDVCKEYERQIEKIKQFPDLKAKIDEFRRRNYELQSSVPQDRLIDELDRFQQEYESFRDIPMVRDFLAAELAYCRTLQEILATIGDELMVNFE